MSPLSDQHRKDYKQFYHHNPAKMENLDYVRPINSYNSNKTIKGTIFSSSTQTEQNINLLTSTRENS